jgi:hypothetical protein
MVFHAMACPCPRIRAHTHTGTVLRATAILVEEWNPIEYRVIAAAGEDYNRTENNDINNDDDFLRKKLRTKETRGLLCARFLVILSLLVTAVIVSNVMYKVTKYAQEEKFQDHF